MCGALETHVVLSPTHKEGLSEARVPPSLPDASGVLPVPSPVSVGARPYTRLARCKLAPPRCRPVVPLPGEGVLVRVGETAGQVGRCQVGWAEALRP